MIWQFYYSKIDHRLRYIRVKDFSTELNCKMSVNLNQYLEDDILNYSSTVMFRETPSIYQNGNYPYLNKNFNHRTSYSLSYSTTYAELNKL